MKVKDIFNGYSKRSFRVSHMQKKTRPTRLPSPPGLSVLAQRA
jgi:hypothetical protein